jgi:hypothetical protein
MKKLDARARVFVRDAALEARSVCVSRWIEVVSSSLEHSVFNVQVTPLMMC